MIDTQARTRLQALVGRLEVLREAPLPHDQRDRLDGAVETILDVLNELDEATLARVFDSSRMRRHYRATSDLGSLGVSAPRALIVEDDPTNMRVAVDMLNVLGLEADTATTGKEALRKIETGIYDIVLLDVMLPHLSGLEVAAEIRKKDVRQPLIVGLTASPSARRESLEAGMDSFLTKPIRIREIAETLGLGSADRRTAAPRT